MQLHPLGVVPNPGADRHGPMDRMAVHDQVDLQGPGKVEICLVRTTAELAPVSGGR
jgi:hypothetical protein